MSSEPRDGGAEPPLVELDGISVRYGGRLALDGVRLRLSRGERVCLVGPNGAGKSTLVRCLTGALAPTTGEVRIDGQRLVDIPRQARARRVAVVPGSVHLPFA